MLKDFLYQSDIVYEETKIHYYIYVEREISNFA